MQPGTWPGTAVKSCDAGTQPTAGGSATAHTPAQDIKLGHPWEMATSSAAAGQCQSMRELCSGGFVTARAPWGIQSASLLVWANDNKPNLRRKEHWKKHFLELLGPNLLFLHWLPLKIPSWLNRILPYSTRSVTQLSLSVNLLRRRPEPR